MSWAEFPAANEACKPTFWPVPGLKESFLWEGRGGGSGPHSFCIGQWLDLGALVVAVTSTCLVYALPSLSKVQALKCQHEQVHVVFWNRNAAFGLLKTVPTVYCFGHVLLRRYGNSYPQCIYITVYLQTRFSFSQLSQQYVTSSTDPSSWYCKLSYHNSAYLIERGPLYPQLRKMFALFCSFVSNEILMTLISWEWPWSARWQAARGFHLVGQVWFLTFGLALQLTRV